MTDEQQALLRTVLENPDDDTPRLVYADWLDEHGQQDRAEFIRVQVELATKLECPDWCDRDPAKCRTTWLERREWELLESNRVQWLKDEPGKMDAWSIDRTMQAYNYGSRVLFRRGFVEEIITPAVVLGDSYGWLSAGPDIILLHPIRRVVLDGVIYIREYGGGDDRYCVGIGMLGPIWEFLVPEEARNIYTWAERRNRQELEDGISDAAIRWARAEATRRESDRSNSCP